MLVLVLALNVKASESSSDTPLTTRWNVHASMGLDALVLIGALSGDKLQAEYYQRQIAYITGRMDEPALAALNRVAARAEESGSLVGPMLALIFSAGPVDTLEDAIQSAQAPEERLRPGLEASVYWNAERWANMRDNAMPDILTVLLSMRDIGFELFWHEQMEPKVLPQVEEMKALLGGYDVIPEQQRLLGRELEPEIELVLLNFSQPYGIKIIGQRLVSHRTFDRDTQLRIAAHEIFHPPFNVNDEALLGSLDSLRRDPWMKSIVENHDPAFGYNSFKGVLNEDSSQALDQIVSERLGFARDPGKRWQHADGGMHMLAAAIYHMLLEDGYDKTGGKYATWLKSAIARGWFEAQEVRRRASEVAGPEAVERWSGKQFG